MLGYFENKGPHIDIEIYGVLKESKKKIKALVDTGFNGFLTLPYVEAFPLALVLTGVQSSTLADGSTSHNFVCLGTVLIGDVEIFVPIEIQPNCPVLIGTQLLEKVGKDLFVDFVNGFVELQAHAIK